MRSVDSPLEEGSGSPSSGSNEGRVATRCDVENGPLCKRNIIVGGRRLDDEKPYLETQLLQGMSKVGGKGRKTMGGGKTFVNLSKESEYRGNGKNF